MQIKAQIFPHGRHLVSYSFGFDYNPSRHDLQRKRAGKIFPAPMKKTCTVTMQVRSCRNLLGKFGENRDGNGQHDQTEDHAQHTQGLIQLTGAEAHQTAAAQTAHTAQNLFCHAK
jgi:hypothetical protein